MHKPDHSNSHSLLVFFLMIRRPPRSTLFPYTTALPIRRRKPSSRPTYAPCCGTWPRPSPRRRSEEHTSELQSHHDLVCRLLLAKKQTCGPSLRNVRNRSRTPRDRRPNKPP